MDDYILLEFRDKIRYDWQNMSPGMKPIMAGFFVTIVYMFFFASPWGEWFQSATRDNWFALRGPREIPKSVTVVWTDIATYKHLTMPSGGALPREYFATAIEKAIAAGAKLVIVDVFFVSKGESEAGDLRLAEAISNTPTVIGRGKKVVIETDPNGKKRKRVEEKIPLELFLTSAKMVLPMQVFSNDNKAVEHIALPTEIIYNLDVNVPLLKALRKFISPELKEPGVYDYINYYGEPSSLTNLSFYKMLVPEETPSEDYFRDRIVFIGVGVDVSTGVVGEDSFMTPVSKNKMYGVEIHATIAANLLDGSWIRRCPLEQEITVLGLLALLGTVYLLMMKLSTAVVLMGVAAIGWAVVSYYSFVHLFLFLPGAGLFCGVFPGVVIVRAITAKEKSMALIKR